MVHISCGSFSFLGSFLYFISFCLCSDPGVSMQFVRVFFLYTRSHSGGPRECLLRGKCRFHCFRHCWVLSSLLFLKKYSLPPPARRAYVTDYYVLCHILFSSLALRLRPFLLNGVLSRHKLPRAVECLARHNRCSNPDVCAGIELEFSASLANAFTQDNLNSYSPGQN